MNEKGKETIQRKNERGAKYLILTTLEKISNALKRQQPRLLANIPLNQYLNYPLPRTSSQLYTSSLLQIENTPEANTYI